MILSVDKILCLCCGMACSLCSHSLTPHHSSIFQEDSIDCFLLWFVFRLNSLSCTDNAAGRSSWSLVHCARCGCRWATATVTIKKDNLIEQMSVFLFMQDDLCFSVNAWWCNALNTFVTTKRVPAGWWHTVFCFHRLQHTILLPSVALLGFIHLKQFN